MKIACAILLLTVLASLQAAAQPAEDLAWLDAYNIAWTSQSKNSGESMPCGGGDVCMNVWVENGDVLFYVQRPGAYDEYGTCLKAGRFRLRLDPNPFADGGEFRQELKLRDGCVEIFGKSGDVAATLRLWADVRRPVVHLEINGTKPLRATASYESWRMAQRFPGDVTWSKQKDRPVVVADDVRVENGAVLFSHRNPAAGLFDTLVVQQKLDGVKAQLWNPLKNLTSGGLMVGEGFVPVGGEPNTGKYAGTEFRAWKLQSAQPRIRQELRLVLHTAQSETPADWRRGLQQQLTEAKTTASDARAQTAAWWRSFWNRSHIVIAPNAPTTSAAWQVGRNYQLFRYMLGCNANGDAPFNGGFFTFDPEFINFLKPGGGGTPDSRAWGGTNHTGQNQRLVYWPMLKSGDGDMMRPQLDFYLRMMKNAELRSRTYWGHDGACLVDQTECFGLPSGWTYWGDEGPHKRPADLEPGLTGADLHQHYYTSEIEFAWMMLELRRYAGTDIARYIPYIESVLTFFNEHYQFRCQQRTGKPFDERGKLVIEPSKALETYEGCTNPTDVLTGLSVTLRGLLDLPDALVPLGHKSKWRVMLDRLPAPVNFATVNGKRLLVPAEKYGRRRNGEIPQLYPLFPYGTYGIGKPDLDDAINCWQLGGPGIVNDKGYISWFQCGIFCARMGLTDEAKFYAIAKLTDSGRRFPAFWGPGFDYAPDHNWGGSGMIGLQDMLLQENGDDLYLLPAWPMDWDVDFKLHAPRQTVVEGRLHNGVLADVKVTGDKIYRVHLPAQVVPPSVKKLELSESFGSLPIPLTNKPGNPGIWQKAVFAADPIVENGAYKTAPQSLISYDFGRPVRGIVSVELRADAAAASGVLEILYDDVTANRFAEKARYHGVMAGLNGTPAFQFYTLDGAEQFNGLVPEWRPIGDGLTKSDGWTQLTIDASQEGFVTITVRDLTSGKTAQSRVKAVEFVHGFRFVRLGSYAADGAPVYFKNLSVRE